MATAPAPEDPLHVDAAALQRYLRECGVLAPRETIDEVKRYGGGYSNLTYRLTLPTRTLVLRRPPPGPHAARAHDVAREYRVLRSVHPVFAKAPAAHLLADGDSSPLGTPFYVMEHRAGPILRASAFVSAPPPAPKAMARASRLLAQTLAELHAVPLTPELLGLGRAEGYVERQVEGWIGRFAKARTEDVAAAPDVVEYLLRERPADGAAALLHGDFKFDNVVFADDQLARVEAVLDWEMSTIGDARMDLGLTLAYWAHAEDVAEMPFLAMNLTHLPGALRRTEVVEVYGAGGQDVLYYYVFGNLKVAGIAQQIYARYRAGHTRDRRFAGLGAVATYMLQRARRAVESGRIE